MKVEDVGCVIKCKAKKVYLEGKATKKKITTEVSWQLVYTVQTMENLLRGRNKKRGVLPKGWRQKKKNAVEIQN